MRALEIACQDSTLPVDIDTVKQFLTKLHDLRKLVLESLMAALQDGKLLLEKLKDLSAEGTLDSRPGHIKTSAEFGKHFVDLHTARVSSRVQDNCKSCNVLRYRSCLPLWVSSQSAYGEGIYCEVRGPYSVIAWDVTV